MKRRDSLTLNPRQCCVYQADKGNGKKKTHALKRINLIWLALVTRESQGRRKLIYKVVSAHGN
jgi:hypothetical protein